MNPKLRKIATTDKPGSVALVGAGPGDPELITLKAVRILRSADIILYDRLCNPEFLNYASPDCRKISVGKHSGKPSVSQHDINRIMVNEATRGRKVVRLKGGDPFIFGRGGEECLELSRNGIPFEVVPGISSVAAVPAYAGIPLTMRNMSTGFTVISGHLHADSPAYDWSVLASVSTLVILMGLRNLGNITGKLTDHGKPADTPVALIRWGTTREQEVVTGTLSDIERKAGDLTPPVTIVIGEVVRQHEALNWFRTESTREMQQLQQGSNSRRNHHEINLSDSKA